jgi:hypothetical protein
MRPKSRSLASACWRSCSGTAIALAPEHYTRYCMVLSRRDIFVPPRSARASHAAGFIPPPLLVARHWQPQRPKYASCLRRSWRVGDAGRCGVRMPNAAGRSEFLKVWNFRPSLKLRCSRFGKLSSRGPGGCGAGRCRLWAQQAVPHHPHPTGFAIYRTRRDHHKCVVTREATPTGPTAVSVKQLALALPSSAWKARQSGNSTLSVCCCTGATCPSR